MKRLLAIVLPLLTLALSGGAWGQGSISTGPPVAVNGLGQPLPGAIVAICTADPGATPVPPCTSTLATTYTDITLATQCIGTSATQPLSNPGGAGSTCSNPGFVDSKGNVLGYAASGTYWCEYYGPGISTYVEPCVFPGLGGGGGGGSVGPGTVNNLAKFTTTTNVGNATCTDDGITPTACGLGVSLVTDALFLTKVNNVSTGTTQSLLVARDSAGKAINAQPTDTNNVIGIAGFGATTTGSVSIAFSGHFSCKFDNQTAINDWVTLGSSSQCHDAGATQPSGTESIGQVVTVNAGAGTLAGVDLGLPNVTNSSTGGGTGIVGPCAVIGGVAYYPTVSSTVGCDANATLDGAGNYTGKSATYSGTTGGFTAFGQGSTPSFTAANSFYQYAPASIPTSIGENLVAANYRVCMIPVGANNGAPVDADLGPQFFQCGIPYSATLVEIDIQANAGTPSVIVGRNRGGSRVNFTASALTTGSSGAQVCANVAGSGAGLMGTTCAVALQNGSLNAGDYIELISGTISTATIVGITAIFRVN